MKDTTLAHFNQYHKTFLIIDAGPAGIGAILAQEQPDNHYVQFTLQVKL